MTKTTRKTKKPVKKTTTTTTTTTTKAIFAYVSAANRTHVLKKASLGKYGSVTKYVNTLIAQDRGV